LSDQPPAHDAGGELSTAALLARIDERTQNMVRDLDNVRAGVNDVKKDIKDLRDEIARTYVTKDEFRPVRMVVYALVGTVLLTVVGAVIALVIVVPRHLP